MNESSISVGGPMSRLYGTYLFVDANAGVGARPPCQLS